MSSPIFTRAMKCISVLILLSLSAQAEWKVDFSRRTKELKESEYVIPENKQEKEGLLESIFSSGEPVQELVVLNTDKGFLPATLRVKEGQRYRIHVVNVNESSKNVSFVLDSFSEHHATYFGKIKTFSIEPKKEGVYSFQCPETSAQGRLVVYSSSGDHRRPASEP